MANTNCLADIKCPDCGNEEEFRIRATTLATVSDDGVEDYADMEWDNNSDVECTECLKAGKLKDFQVDPEDTDEGKAKARLITAAPDLLQALLGMLEMFVDSDHYADFEDLETVAFARATIAKATAA